MNRFVLWVLVASVVGLGCSSKPTLPDSSAINSPPMEGKEGCDSPLGYIPEGGSAKGYLRPIEQGGLTCQQGELICRDGNWTGAYIYPSCSRAP